jgi:crossover junction endodeoxyribonuclease RusA
MSKDLYQRFIVTRPPSLNSIYATHVGKGSKSGTRRVKTKKYTDWLAANLRTLALDYNIEPIRGRVGVAYKIPALDRRQRDIGNMEKAMSDLLVQARIIQDDCFIDHIEISRVSPVPDQPDADHAAIEVWSLPNRETF